jgi:glycosyltransferase involved in cell wall biosynthesis
VSTPVTYFEDVAIVMITMDEEDSIRRVARDLRRDVPGAAVTIVDSSADRTPEIAIEEGIEVVRQFPPRGYGPAMARALTHPDRPIVVTLDCDDTYPTQRISELVHMVRTDYDIAGTTRLAGGRLVATMLFARPVRDVHSGMRAYRRETIQGFSWLAEPPALPVELLLLPIRAGLRVKEIPIAYGERIGDSTLQRFSSTLWTFRRIMRARFVRLDRVRVGVSPPLAAVVEPAYPHAVDEST